MGTTLLTRDEWISNVQGFGYAHAKVEFLSLVVLYDGDFLRRQFEAWIGRKWGNRSEDFLADLLHRGHRRRHVFVHNRQVFHWQFRPLYREVDDENSRNRNEHQAQAIQACLTMPDFVLAHSENVYLATEREKVQHLCAERGIAPEALPAKVFLNADGSALTARYLLDLFPLFTRPGVEVLAFCHVDSGFETSGPFATHLRDYLPLFAELASFELVYVATAWTRLGRAQSLFEGVLSKERKWLKMTADPHCLLAHFHDRQLFEKRENSSFDRFRLDVFRDDTDRFSARHFAEMFARWEISGDEAIRAEIAAQKVANGRFSSRILSPDCDMFDRAEAASLNPWICVDLVNAAKKARSPQFRWRRSPKTAFGAPQHGPFAPTRGGWTPVSGSGEGRERPRFRSAAPPQTLPRAPLRLWVTPAPPPRVHQRLFATRTAGRIDRQLDVDLRRLPSFPNTPNDGVIRSHRGSNSTGFLESIRYGRLSWRAASNIAT